MDMKVIRMVRKLCICCMDEHDIDIVVVREKNIFKGTGVEYDAEYHYCDRADELYADEAQITANDISMKDAYRGTVGLLTSDQIANIRARFGISQNDLCTVLNWGAKTITRYESHQVQDAAHDTILRKLDADPEWFLELLHGARQALSSDAYLRYIEAGTARFEQASDVYLKNAIMARYECYQKNPILTGNTRLSLDAVMDMIRYCADFASDTELYKAKLIRLLWYADALSYKRRGHAISGMVYRAQPAGAVPVAYDSIAELSTISNCGVETGNGTVYRFKPNENKTYKALTGEDRVVLDAVMRRFGDVTGSELIRTMHREDAYTQTAENEIISFQYAQTLSIS